MPDLYTDDMVESLATSLLRVWDIEVGAGDQTWRDFEDEARAHLDEVAPLIAAKALRTYAKDLDDNLSAEDWDRKHEFVDDVRVYADEVERGLIP